MLEVEALAIPDVKLIRPKRFGDERGYFQQTYHREQYEAVGIDADFVQDNVSCSRRGALRGLHYQLENAQAKLVSTLVGSVYDVAVDLRKSSPTFGQWVGAALTAENGHQLFVPRGFAHGFIVTSDEAIFSYKCDDLYAPGDEYGVLWSSAELAIHWPDLQEISLSEKDLEAPDFSSIPPEHLFD